MVIRQGCPIATCVCVCVCVCVYVCVFPGCTSRHVRPPPNCGEATLSGQGTAVSHATDDQGCDILRTNMLFFFFISTNKTMPRKTHNQVFPLSVTRPHCYCVPVHVNYSGTTAEPPLCPSPPPVFDLIKQSRDIFGLFCGIT